MVVLIYLGAFSPRKFTELSMEGQPPDASVAGPPVRGPPCVALASAQCRASPSRSCHYTPVPDAYRAEHQLDDDACVCSSNLCHRMVSLMPPARQPGRRPKKRGHGQESPLADVSPTLQMPPNLPLARTRPRRSRRRRRTNSAPRARCGRDRRHSERTFRPCNGAHFRTACCRT